jgi:hypothetical protein
VVLESAGRYDHRPGGHRRKETKRGDALNCYHIKPYMCDMITIIHSRVHEEEDVVVGVHLCVTTPMEGGV